MLPALGLGLLFILEDRDMNTINLSELIKGLMVVIGIAASMGKLPELKRWAAQEAFRVRPAHHLQIRSEKHRNGPGKGTESSRNGTYLNHF